MMPVRPYNARTCSLIKFPVLAFCIFPGEGSGFKSDELSPETQGIHDALLFSFQRCLSLTWWFPSFLVCANQSLRLFAMHSLECIIAVLATASHVAAVPRASHVRGRSSSPVQRYLGPPSTYVYNQTRADAVKQTFQISWDGYYKYAFPGDSLLPVSNSFENDRSVQVLDVQLSCCSPLTSK